MANCKRFGSSDVREPFTNASPASLFVARQPRPSGLSNCNKRKVTVSLTVKPPTTGNCKVIHVRFDLLLLLLVPSSELVNVKYSCTSSLKLV
jgi:hypothetical protein